jgi:hypothetical protein
MPDIGHWSPQLAIRSYLSDQGKPRGSDQDEGKPVVVTPSPQHDYQARGEEKHRKEEEKQNETNKVQPMFYSELSKDASL